MLRATSTGALQPLPVPLGGWPVQDRQVALDGLGRLYVLLPEPTHASAWSGVRRFEEEADPVDLTLRPRPHGLIDFQVDDSGRLHFLAENDGEPAILTYSADGSLERSQPLSRLDLVRSEQGPCRRTPLGLARLAVAGDGGLYLFYPRLRMVSGAWVLDGDWLQMDPGRRHARPLTFSRPGWYLSEIFSAGRGVILVWTEPLSEPQGDSPFLFSADTARRHLEILEGEMITLLGTVSGRLVDAAPAGALIELPGGPESGQTESVLSFVPFLPATGSP